MDKKLEQLFYAVLDGAMAVKEKIEANSEEIKAWQEKSEKTLGPFLMSWSSVEKRKRINSGGCLKTS